MEEYQIQNIDLVVKLDISHTEIEQVTGQHHIWAKTLANACANLFDSSIINYPQEKGFRFVGSKENTQCATQLFWHLFRAWKGMCATDYKNDKPDNRQLYRKSHGLGFAGMIWNRVSELTEERHSNIVKSTGTDLVVVSDSKIKQYMDDNFQLTQPKQRALTKSLDGFMKGTEAGKKVNLSAPITRKNSHDKLRHTTTTS